jgi:hypothetical protein
MKSRRDNEEPNLDIPYTAKDAPTLRKVRRDMDDPIITKSIIDIEEPKREMPNTERALPIRTNVLNDKELPK